tara:strand:+ start:967 stop:1371 length:405 start_codon:yes stop_codon:yes gene_type:complete
MDRVQVLRAFNDHFQEFVDDVTRVFPDDTELRTVAKSLVAIRKLNPRVVMTVFKARVVGPYRAQLEAGHVDFFVDKNWSGDVVESPEYGLSRATILDKIERMRTSVRSMTDKDQEKAVQYLRNLAKLTELYDEK